MKKIGLVGGTGPAATVLYYKKLTEMSERALGAGHIAPLSIESVDCGRVLELSRSDPQALSEYIAQAVRCLERTGCELVALTGMTPHRVFGEIATMVNVPMVSMLDSMLGQIRNQNIRRVLLLGTDATMASDFVAGPLKAAGVSVLVPDEAARRLLSEAIEEEIEYGRRTEACRERLLAMFSEQAAKSGAEALLLANTDFGPYFENSTMPLAAIDPVQAHLEELLRQALG